ncbi:hypothetical protein QBC35DRAFT_517950 [Podospora australis]|uniref:Uncharacterized protein n=1 Tax=Podospora australis TaxID=1536484 RepID=A0AAN6WP69_9PEZI|nr:hypothetical protein QBC35DRAFT_517950 [Podospora australis]
MSDTTTTPTKSLPHAADSKNGNKYQIGVARPDVSQEISIQKAGFAVDVNWGPSEDWVYLDSDLANRTRITRYKLVQNPEPGPDFQGIWYEWDFWFTNTDSYDYFFEDRTHDEYENNTWLKRDHFTSYNSSDPTIIRVRGV